VDWTVFILIK
jgi:Y_Y_Y domain